MGKVCKKCGHERRPEDIGPDYECPNCGAVYAKVEARMEKEIEEKDSCPGLREKYQALTLKELENIRANAVLDNETKQVLIDVILEKQRDGGKQDALHQQQK